MKSEPRKPDSFGQLSLFLAFFLTVLFIVQGYASFGRGAVDLIRPIVAILISAAGCLVSFRLSLLLPGERTSNRRALIGTAMMVFVLYALIGFAQFTPLRDRLQPWEFLILPVCTFTFFLNSQLSFLILSITEGSILLWSLKDPSSFVMAVVVLMAYALALMLLLAVLHFRERQNEVPDAPPLDREIPLRVGPVAGLLLLDLFGLFLVVKPQEPVPTAPASGPRASAESGDPEEEPILGMGRRGLETTSVGFERDLKFGDLKNPAETDHDVIMLVQMRWGTDRSLRPEEVDFPLVWKMAALGEYDGQRWRPFVGPETLLKGKEGQLELPTSRPASRFFWVEQRILLSPMNHRGLFMLYPPKLLVDQEQISVDVEGTLLRPALADGPFKYTVMSYVQQRLRDRLEVARASHPDERYLEVPSALQRDSNFQALAGRLKSAPTHIDAIERCVSLLSGFKYMRSPGLVPGRDPTREFLRLRRGYCQHFASTMALLLRQIGIPSRVAIGFAGGEWSDAANAIVLRRRHAHAWVEVHFDGLGWLPFDPVLAVQAPAPTAESPNPDRPSETPKPAPGPAPGPSGDLTKKNEELRQGNAPVDKPAGVLPDPVKSAESFDDLWSKTENRARGTAALKPAEAPPAAVETPSGSRPRTSGEFYSRMALGDTLLLAAAGSLGVLMLAMILRRRRQSLAPALALQAAAEADGTSPSLEKTRGFLLFPRGSKRRQLIDLYIEFVKRAGKLGFGKDEGQTAAEYSELLRQCVDPGPEGLDDLTVLFEKARYSDASISPEDFEKAKSSVKAAFGSLKNSRKPA